MGTRKTHTRIKASLRNLDGKDSHNISFISPMPINENDVENLFTALCDVEISEIWRGVIGYNYQALGSLCTVSCKGRYLYNGLYYTTERMYFKYVRKSLATKEAFLPYMKAIYGTTFEFNAFDKSIM